MCLDWTGECWGEGSIGKGSQVIESLELSFTPNSPILFSWIGDLFTPGLVQ